MGRSQTIAEWSKITGISIRTIRGRLKYGWTTSDVLTPKKNHRRLTLDGRSMTMLEWQKETGIGRTTIRNRIEDGWTVRDALTKPTRQVNTITLDDRSLTMDEWVEELGVSECTIRARFKRGWNLRDALTRPVKPLPLPGQCRECKSKLDVPHKNTMWICDPCYSDEAAEQRRRQRIEKGLPLQPPLRQLKIGDKFGAWTLVGSIPRKKRKERTGKQGTLECRRWLCRCICGLEKDLAQPYLLTKNITSCGCLSGRAPTDFIRSESTLPTKSDGRTKNPRYSQWYGMMSRCYHEKSNFYKDYGGRGIFVHGEWHNFWLYVEWMDANIGDRPSKKHSIDRIDNDGGYEPGNVRWATQKQQVGNQRTRTTMRILTIDGVTKTLVEWARKSLLDGLNSANLASRLDAGWTPERALATPLRRPNPKK